MGDRARRAVRPLPRGPHVGRRRVAHARSRPRAAGLGERVLVLTSELPRRRTEFDLALRAAGPGGVFDVIDVFDDDELGRLAAYAEGRTTPIPGFWNPDELVRVRGV